VAGEKVGDGNLALKAKIGLLPDVPAFYDWMSGRDFLHFVGELHGLTPTDNNKRTEELLALVELTKHGNRRAGGYSRGMRQRLGIAQALMNRPQVLFLDEPTSALDPLGHRDVLNLILRLRENTTIFMSSHNLSDIERVCDMVGIVNKGKLITVSTVDALQKKYARSIFEIEFLEDAGQFVESLKKIPWLAEPAVTTVNGTPIITVRAIDIERARKELPRLIAESNLTMTRYEMMLPSIEDIFAEIITGGEKK
jgi:ABC-2 type transport system ATP-binding protein